MHLKHAVDLLVNGLLSLPCKGLSIQHSQNTVDDYVPPAGHTAEVNHATYQP
jgi:hypothetical protein